MRLRFRHQLIWTLALLLGQFLSFAHAFEHPALAAEPHCQVCVHAQALSAGAISEFCASIPALHGIEAPQRASWSDTGARLSSLHRIRGPPRITG